MSPTHQPNISLPDHDAGREFSVSEISDEIYKPKSPGRFTSLFRWGSTSEQGIGSTATSLSDRGPSPSISPKTGTSTSSKSIPPVIDVLRANAVQTGTQSDSAASSLPITPSSFDMIEDEVRAVSADLAASIRREMDLEDLIDRLQAEAAERNCTGRRTSDYFSDAGTPVRILDRSSGQDVEPEKLVRRAEQEKAQLRLEMLGKIKEEREKRKTVESHVKELQKQITKTAQLVDSGPSDSGHVGDFDGALDEAKRKLLEERRMKENFEDLLNALKEELEANRNERDNLRDEVVPQLRARVEGLESEASDLQKLMYEHSRMQQELASLKNENASLATAVRNQSRQSQPGSPSGYSTPISPPNILLPLNPKDRDLLHERVSVVEAQRDALHKALKNLICRQDYERKESKKQISFLQAKVLLEPNSRKNNREISSLRREVDRLRQRADDARERKFVCERNLGNLRMDLERAEHETSTLRALLQEHDSLVYEHEELKVLHGKLSKQVSELKQDLNATISCPLPYRETNTVLSPIREQTPPIDSQPLEILSESTEQSKHAINGLRKSLMEAEMDRDVAIAEAAVYHNQARSLQGSESLHLQEERTLASQLRHSSARVEELAGQVRSQLESNKILRERLVDCITRGENEQRISARRINDLQGRLKSLEDKVLEAQQLAEDAVTQHEEEIRLIKETHTSQLRRLKAITIKLPTFSPKTPKTPFFKGPSLIATSPKISGPDSSRTDILESRVSELERALSDADSAMAEVVSRMNHAQIEVVELQTERDEAVRQTKRLQADMVIQKAKHTTQT